MKIEQIHFIKTEDKIDMDIYILRHGKASERLPTKSDSTRSLTAEGIEEMREIGSAIKNFDIKFNQIISSPLDRAIETAKIVAERISYKEKSIIMWEELKPESTVLEIQKKLSEQEPDAKILLVGHEPNLTNLISSIISKDSISSINLKKGGFAHLKAESANSRVTGTLRSILTPKQLKLCK